MERQPAPQRKNRKRAWVLLAIGGLLVLSGCQAYTTPATSVGTTTATLNAQASCAGGAPTPCSWYWQWGTNGSYQYSSPVSGPVTVKWSGTLSYTVTGLSPGTTYNFELCGRGDSVSSYACVNSNSGTVEQFTTAANTSGGMSAPPGYSNKIFEDSFTGSNLDSSKWVTYLGAQGAVWNNWGQLPLPYSGPNVTGSSYHLEMYSPAQVSVSNGLTLTAQHNTNQWASEYPWISGVVSTEGKFSLPTNTPWYVQVKAKMPDQSQGMWPAIWFMPGVSGTASNELDGYEGGWSGTSPNEIMHSGFFAPQGEPQAAYNVGADVTAGYHVYGIEFKPGVSITAYFDGTPVWQVLASNGYTIAGEPYEILLELQVASQQASGWHTVTNANTPNSSMSIAEVQAYD